MRTTDKPIAEDGLNSYRYLSRLGAVMIGANNDKDAMCEVRRSISDFQVCPTNLQRWDGEKYVNVIK